MDTPAWDALFAIGQLVVFGLILVGVYFWLKKG